jgi:hypothetical protein
MLKPKTGIMVGKPVILVIARIIALGSFVFSINRYAKKKTGK